MARATPSGLAHQQQILNTTDIVVVLKDMTEVNADVYCNSCTSNLEGGELASTLARVGGRGYEESRKRVGRTGSNGLAVSDPGDLNCKHVIHLDIFSNGTWKDRTIRVLQEANRLEAQSIAMPAFGTGAARQDPQAVGKGMLEAIAEFVLQGGCTTLNRITIVLVQERLLDSFNMAECVPLQPQDPEYLGISQSREFRGRLIERIERLPQPIPLQTFPRDVPRDIDLAPDRYVAASSQPRPHLRRSDSGHHESFGFREEEGMSIPYLTESSREHRSITLASVLTGSMRGDDNVASDDNVTEESQASSKESTATVSSDSSLHSLSDTEIEGEDIQEEKNVAAALGDLSMFTSSDGKILVSTLNESMRSWYSVHLSNENNQERPQNN
ncbi:uncharacterized protein LOC106162870 [Lingula anatina]|uniref:Uncharacterized protein LOC106162870 n=1 Tax=Lingula anatina TaxID=7574 RepID=A0A1S3IE72_LINAN|nr:uncharacterized protein LOC106162870 [Lingula anatina]|eukprot:XP_013395754.1 uncharacterized protein LOC106162870 [Lingula anatina]